MEWSEIRAHLSSLTGGIQLAALAKVAGLSDLPCYSGFLATTRVSNQINSVSEDFAYGALKKCGLVLQANCLGGRQHNVSLIPYTIAPFDWNYTVSITNLYLPYPHTKTFR
jgi:hypothetical protein